MKTLLEAISALNALEGSKYPLSLSLLSAMIMF
jgi:hypothetical protein